MLNLVVRKVSCRLQKVNLFRRFEKRSAMTFKGAPTTLEDQGGTFPQNVWMR